jgi:hypothetical protein
MNSDALGKLNKLFFTSLEEAFSPARYHSFECQEEVGGRTVKYMVETYVAFPRSCIPTFIWRRRVKPQRLQIGKSDIGVTIELDDFLYTEKENVR